MRLINAEGDRLETPGEPLVEAIACGLCHAGLSFADGSVTSRHALPPSRTA